MHIMTYVCWIANYINSINFMASKKFAFHLWKLVTYEQTYKYGVQTKNSNFSNVADGWTSSLILLLAVISFLRSVLLLCKKTWIITQWFNWTLHTLTDNIQGWPESQVAYPCFLRYFPVYVLHNANISFYYLLYVCYMSISLRILKWQLQATIQ